MLHFSLRMYESELARPSLASKRVVIVGAGDGGATIVRQLCMNPDPGIRHVAIVDDDHTKIGSSVCGVPVLRDLTRLKHVVSVQQASEIGNSDLHSQPYTRANEAGSRGLQAVRSSNPDSAYAQRSCRRERFIKRLATRSNGGCLTARPDYC